MSRVRRNTTPVMMRAPIIIALYSFSPNERNFFLSVFNWGNSRQTMNTTSQIGTAYTAVSLPDQDTLVQFKTHIFSPRSMLSEQNILLEEVAVIVLAYSVEEENSITYLEQNMAGFYTAHQPIVILGIESNTTDVIASQNIKRGERLASQLEGTYFTVPQQERFLKRDVGMTKALNKIISLSTTQHASRFFSPHYRRNGSDLSDEANSPIRMINSPSPTLSG